MKQQKMLNTNKGITLIALVITIIVMLILVVVTISMAINGGLFKKAKDVSGKTNNAIKNEQLLANGRIKIDGKWYNSIDEFVNSTENNDTCPDCGELNDECICEEGDEEGTEDYCGYCGELIGECICETCAGCDGVAIEGVCYHCGLDVDECAPCDKCGECSCDTSCGDEDDGGEILCESCGYWPLYGADICEGCDTGFESCECCPDCGSAPEDCECDFA